MHPGVSSNTEQAAALPTAAPAKYQRCLDGGQRHLDTACSSVQWGTAHSAGGVDVVMLQIVCWGIKSPWCARSSEARQCTATTMHSKWCDVMQHMPKRCCWHKSSQGGKEAKTGVMAHAGTRLTRGLEPQVHAAQGHAGAHRWQHQADAAHRQCDTACPTAQHNCCLCQVREPQGSL